MFFGSYLVSEGIIDEEVAIKAAINQVESCPSFLSLVYELELLEKDKILKILNQCEVEKLSFSAICKREGHLNSNDYNHVLDLLSSKANNYSKILIENYGVDGNILKENFDKFIENQSSSKVEVNEAKANVKEKSINSAAIESLKELGTLSDEEIRKLVEDETNVENTNSNSSDEGLINEAALESLKELGAIAPEELAELENKVKSKAKDVASDIGYEEHFSQKIYNKMIKIIDMTRNSAETGSDVSNTLNSLYKELLMLRENAQKVNAKISEKLMATIQLLLEETFQQDNKKLLSWALINLDTLKESINLAWELRNIMCETGSEIAFWSTESSKMRYTNNIKKIREISQF